MSDNINGVLEYKSAIIDSLKDVDTAKRVMVGKFADYQSPDFVGDVSQKGMFDRTWRETKARVKHLYEHDTTKIIGKIAELWDDNAGAYYKSLVPKHKFGDDMLEMGAAGLLNEHSFGYVAKKASKNKHGGRDLHEVMHLEVTTVGGGWAIHGNTPLLSVSKSLNLDSIETLMEKMNAKYKALSNFCYKATASDDTLEDMEQKTAILLLEIKQLQQTILDMKANSTPVAEEAQASQKEVKSAAIVALNADIANTLITLQNL